MTTGGEKSKRRWPLAIRAAIAMVVLLAVGAGGLYLMGRASEARWLRYAAELRAAGNPLTFDEIEKLRKVIPDDENSALVITQLTDRLKKVGHDTGDGDVFVFRGAGKTVDFFGGIRRGLIEPSRKLLERYRGLLGEINQMRDMPRGRFDLVIDPNGTGEFNVAAPYISHVRNASKLVHLDAELRLVDGDVAGAADTVPVQLAISATLNEHPTLISRLVQTTVENLAVQTVEDALRVGELDDATLARLSERITAALNAGTMKWALWGERAFFMETCDGIAAQKITFSQLMTTESDAANVAYLPEFLIRSNEACGVEMYSWLVDAVDDPVALMKAAERVEAEISKLPITQSLVKILVPSLARMVVFELRLQAKLRCALAALAAERFRLTSGHLPTSLLDLVPEFLDAVPVDPFDGKPMRFATTDEGIAIYSISNDLVDDGGQVERKAKHPRFLDVGFRLFKPEHRGLLLIDAPDDGSDGRDD